MPEPKAPKPKVLPRPPVPRMELPPKPRVEATKPAGAEERPETISTLKPTTELPADIESIIGEIEANLQNKIKRPEYSEVIKQTFAEELGKLQSDRLAYFTNLRNFARHVLNSYRNQDLEALPEETKSFIKTKTEELKKWTKVVTALEAAEKGSGGKTIIEIERTEEEPVNIDVTRSETSALVTEPGVEDFKPPEYISRLPEPQREFFMKVFTELKDTVDAFQQMGMKEGMKDPLSRLEILTKTPIEYFNQEIGHLVMRLDLDDELKKYTPEQRAAYEKRLNEEKEAYETMVAALQAAQKPASVEPVPAPKLDKKFDTVRIVQPERPEPKESDSVPDLTRGRNGIQRNLIYFRSIGNAAEVTKWSKELEKWQGFLDRALAREAAAAKPVPETVPESGTAPETTPPIETPEPKIEALDTLVLSKEDIGDQIVFWLRYNGIKIKGEPSIVGENNISLKLETSFATIQGILENTANSFLLKIYYFKKNLFTRTKTAEEAKAKIIQFPEALKINIERVKNKKVQKMEIVNGELVVTFEPPKEKAKEGDTIGKDIAKETREAEKAEAVRLLKQTIENAQGTLEENRVRREVLKKRLAEIKSKK